MPVQIPSIHDIETSFRTAITGAGLAPVQSVDSHFERHRQTISDSQWSNLGAGVETLDVGSGVRLFRITFAFRLDPHGTGEIRRLRVETAAIRNAVRSMIPQHWVGEFANQGADVRNEGPLTSITCLTKGVIRGLPSNVAAAQS
jgi:hypothetical protein